MKKESVLVALSGGVDSAASLLMLKEKGYRIVGVSLGLNISERKFFQSAEDFCRKFNISFYFYDVHSDFKEEIMGYFKREYLRGRTPNPCVMCNRLFKFGKLFEIKEKLELDYMATGHYVRLEKHSDGQFYFYKGEDENKDQTYFLWNVRRDVLPHLLFPLGKWKKSAVREYMQKKDVELSQKTSSQDVCFINSDYRAWLREEVGESLKISGKIIDTSGKVLGYHSGILNYTIGQRKGLGIASPYPLYVLKIDFPNNQIIVGKKEEIYHKKAYLSEVNLFDETLLKKEEFECEVKVRYRHQAARAKVKLLLEKRAIVEFEKSQWAITPGQSAVFYIEDRLLGGGIIDENS
jgi:tRNA-specific 2-thiouridylase